MKFEAFLDEVEACNETFVDALPTTTRPTIAMQMSPRPDGFCRSMPCQIDTVQWHLEDGDGGRISTPMKHFPSRRSMQAIRRNRYGGAAGHRTSKGSRGGAQSGCPTEYRKSSLGHGPFVHTRFKDLHRRKRPIVKMPRCGPQGECGQKLAVLIVQQEDLTRSIAQLVEDIYSGQRIMKVYRQMKMYNDPSLNPVLHKSGQEG